MNINNTRGIGFCHIRIVFVVVFNEQLKFWETLPQQMNQAFNKVREKIRLHEMSSLLGVTYFLLLAFCERHLNT